MSNEPLLDMQVISELRELLGDDIRELYEEYLVDTRRVLEEMKRAAVDNDLGLLIPLAHTLKGSSGNLGVTLVYNLARQLESQARTGSLADPENGVVRISEAFTASQDALRQLAGIS